MVPRSLVLLAVAASPAACTADDPGEPPAAVTEAAGAQVLDRYDSYQRALLAALVKGDDAATALAEFTGEPLLSSTRDSIAQMRRAGVVGKGEQRWSPRIVELKRATATIEDCTDISAWTVVSTGTGEPVPPPAEQPDKFIVTSTAKLTGGKWYIVGSDGDWSRPC